ncbi:MAG: hypothetical protein U0132_20880 [Gemmatimonadaceae bacterium]
MAITTWLGMRASTRAFLLGLIVCAVPSSAAPLTTSKRPRARDAEGTERCSLADVTPQRIVDRSAGQSEWHGRFDLPDTPALWAPAPADTLLGAFQSRVRQRLGGAADARSLGERQRAIFAKMPAEFKGEATNAELLASGRAGTITPMGCLEAMLWTWQAARYPMFDHPTEFGAFVTRGQGRVHVYLSSADLVGQKLRDAVTAAVQADLAAGYRLIAHIHNHPFLFDRVVGDRMWTIEGTKDDVAGALAPSMTDVQFYRSVRASQGLEGAWVTNGFETSHFTAAEFDLLIGR